MSHIKEPSGVYSDLIVNAEQLRNIVVKAEHLKNIEYPFPTKIPYRHSVKSKSGKSKGAKPSVHRNKNLWVQVIVPIYTIDNHEHIVEFQKVVQARTWIRKNIPQLRASALTNIGSAIAGTGRFKNKQGYAYGLIFKNIYKGNNNPTKSKGVN